MSTDHRRDSDRSRARDTSPLADCSICHASCATQSPVPVTNAGDSSEPVGRFHYATLLRNRLQVITSWQVSADDYQVRARVADLLGRASQDIGADILSITTETTTIEVILHGPGALRLRWCRDGCRTCDGKVQSDNGTQRSCMCPPSLPERRTATRHGRGCEPRVEVFFRLAQDPDLGVFTFASGSWSLTEQVINARISLQADSQPTRARLSLQRTLHRLYSGRTLAYTRPVLAVVGTSPGATSRRMASEPQAGG